jgi:unsaturated chondroitin disaccharide hydrolase
MPAVADRYFARAVETKTSEHHQAALGRCISRLHEQVPVIGLRNSKISDANNRWIYCDGSDWVVGFYSGILLLTFQMTGDIALLNLVQARRPVFRRILESRRDRNHDLGFQFSLHSVGDWLLTGDPISRDMALRAANTLIGRFRPGGGYIQAWSPLGPGDRQQAAFVNGRVIADTMQNLALLQWAYRETGITEAGVYLLAAQVPTGEAAGWRAFGDRLIDGLLSTCDLTQTPNAQGFLAYGAAHVPAGRCDSMLPYGDYYFMEALMRSLGHKSFFW